MWFECSYECFRYAWHQGSTGEAGDCFMDSTKVEAAVHATSNYVSGTEGYPEDAPELIKRYESVSSAAVHKPILHLVPTNPCRVLDVGSGSGRDAAWFAAMGHEVVAVEP